jgi:hypothetical protein
MTPLGPACEPLNPPYLDPPTFDPDPLPVSPTPCALGPRLRWRGVVGVVFLCDVYTVWK